MGVSALVVGAHDEEGGHKGRPYGYLRRRHGPGRPEGRPLLQPGGLEVLQVGEALGGGQRSF